MEAEQTTAKAKQKEKQKPKSKIKFRIIQKEAIPDLTLTQVELEITQYIEQLTEIEKLVIEIAKEQLESSFDIEKTIGFLNWKKEKQS